MIEKNMIYECSSCGSSFKMFQLIKPDSLEYCCPECNGNTFFIFDDDSEVDNKE